MISSRTLRPASCRSMYWAVALAGKKTDIDLPRSNETDKCADMSNNLYAFLGVKRIIELQFDSDVQFPQGIDVNSANCSEILGGKSCSINCDVVAIEVYNDYLYVSKDDVIGGFTVCSEHDV